MHFLHAILKGGDVRMYLRSLWTDPWRTPPDRLVKLEHVKFFIRRRTSDLFVLDEVFRRRVYGEPPRGIVIDLGANIGAYSLFAAQTAEKVFAFEPEHSNYEQLKKNISLNRNTTITPFKKAAGGERGTMALSVQKINKGAASLVLRRTSDSQSVEVVTLEDVLNLCSVTQVDVLKVDIEGSEYALFENAPREILRRINTIRMETHDVKGKNIENLKAQLRDAGFDISMTHTRMANLGMVMLNAARKMA